MELNRQIIKNQAKSLIKGKVIPLFLVCAVVSFLTSASSIFSTSFEFDKYDDRFSFSQGYDFDDPFGSFDIDEFESDNENDSDDAQWNSGFFDDFAGNITVKNMSLSSSDVLHKMISSATASVFSIVSTVFFALFIPLKKTFLQFIRGENKSVKDNVKNLFATYFDKHFFQRYFSAVVVGAATVIGVMFFLVPGIILHYRWYFVYYILADKPGISLSQAMTASKKMTKGHKWELFKLDLSFLGWYILVPLTCGLGAIYVLPYVNTTMALYYENFRIRALQEFKVSDVDFMTEDERKQQYYESIVNANKQAKVSDFGSYEPVEYFNNLH